MKSTNYLNTAYLDQPHRVLFEQMAVNEKLLLGGAQNSIIGEDLHLFQVKQKKSLQNPDMIFDCIMLFEKIDSSFSYYSWDSLIEIGITPNSPKANRLEFSNCIAANPHLRDDPTYKRCRRSTSFVLRDNLETVMPMATWLSIERMKESGATISEIRNFRRSAKVVVKNIIAELGQSNEWEAVDTRFRHISQTSFDRVTHDLIAQTEFLFNSYLEELYFSTMDDGAVLSLIVPKPTTLDTCIRNRAAFDLLCTVRFHFGREIVLPKPASIAEAVEYRELNQLKRLREVLNEWCRYLEDGNEVVQSKIRSDVSKATADLMRLKRVKEFRKSLYYITLNVIGGQIPVFSNVLSVVNGGLDLYQAHVDYRTAWIGKS